MDDHRRQQQCRDAETAAAADDQLLRQFVATGDEQAFRQLVARHSELVLGVCLRILRDRHDAEDAFQAAFMVLAKKAASVRGGQSLAPWLYGVAYRIAIRAHQRRSRRKMDALPADVASIEESLEGVWECHWRRALDDELNLLPEKYRGPLVLHYLQGKTNNEVATELGLSVHAVEGRQRRGKALLKRRLALRKVTLPLAVSAVATTAAAEASASLLDATVAASIAFVSGTSAAGGASVARLAQNEVTSMSTSSLAPASVGVALLAVFGAAVAGIGGYAVAQSGPSQPLSAAVQSAVAHELMAETDLQVAPAAFDAKEPQLPKPLLSWTADGSADLVQWSDAERRILAALESEATTLDFSQTPLSNVMDFISERHGIQIWFDTAALDEVALSPDVEVTARLTNLPLKSALRLLLEQVEGLTYVIRDDVLVITTEDEAQSTLETHVYDASKALAATSVGIEDLVVLIPKSVETSTWEMSGTGEGTIAALGQRFLVITQPQAIHEEIAAFLRQLDSISPSND